MGLDLSGLSKAQGTFRGLGDPGVGTPKGPKMAYFGMIQHGDSAAVTPFPRSRTRIWGSRPPKWGYLELSEGGFIYVQRDSGV